MKLKLLDVEFLVKANNLKEVTNPVILDRGSIPTMDGLLSTDIFGMTPKERKTTWAYINLHGHFLTPLAYRELRKLDRRIDYIIGGTKKYVIKNGELIEDPSGETGIEWLYLNWDKLKFKRNQSRLRSEKIDFFESNKKDVIFITSFIVLPAFYRDINLQSVGEGRPSLHEINVGSEQTNGSSYSKLLRLVTTLRASQGFAFALNNTRFQIQQCMNDIYEYFKSRIEKKYGIIKKGIMGKTVDYGSRLVISSSHFNTESYKDNLVDSTHCGLPLANCISNATPFFVGWLSNFFKKEFENSAKKYPVKRADGKVEYIEIKNPEAYFNDEYCTKLMDKFIRSYNERFDPIEIPTVDGSKCYMVFKGRLANAKEKIESGDVPEIAKRPMKLTDLMYRAAVDIYQDKHVFISRYPITSFQSLYTIRVRPLSTQETCKMIVNGKEYPFYPVIDFSVPKNDVGSKFVDILMMQNTYLKGLNGDYDGDQVSVRTVFTQEANLECERLMKNPTNYLSANGTNIRTTTNEAIQTLYCLTKD